MHLILGKALVSTPSTIYSNSYVELDSEDDVTLTASVRNRQGIVLETISGSFEMLNPTGGWLLHTDAGDVSVEIQDGCGCGGTSVTLRVVE